MVRLIRNSNLTEWCLQVIIDNLHFYIKNDNVPQKHIDFLLRLYSEKVYSLYKNSNYMPEDTHLWFLNRYNKVVTLPIVSESIVRRLEIVGQSITSLTLKNSLASEKILSSIVCCVPNLTYLDLSLTSCSNSTLMCVKVMCSSLKSLNVSDCDRVTDDGMEILSKSNLSLRDLDITYSGVKDTGLRCILKGMPSLQCLKFSNLADALYRIHEDDFRTGAYQNIKYNLTELVYQCKDYCNDPINMIWAWTTLCPKVKKVHFKLPLHKNVLEMCEKFKNLEEIEIRMSHTYFIPDVLVPLLPTAKNLRKLFLINTTISVRTLIESFTNLEILFLKNVRFTNFEEGDIKIKETKLDVLTIVDTSAQFSPLTFKNIELLISVSKNVTKLYLNIFKNLPEELCWTILNTMKSLTTVDFSFNSITKDFFKYFLNIPSLRRIYCDLCKNFPPFDFCLLPRHSACTLSWRIMEDDYDPDTPMFNMYMESEDFI